MTRHLEHISDISGFKYLPGKKYIKRIPINIKRKVIRIFINIKRLFITLSHNTPATERHAPFFI